MTNRELLELAAKTAGLIIDKSPYNGGGTMNDGFDICGNAVLDWHNGTTWNPLADDGDALRLAVKLGMFMRQLVREIPRAEYAADPYAATRRAIVRAAAEIGAQE